jgi:hypothetical protein
VFLRGPIKNIFRSYQAFDTILIGFMIYVTFRGLWPSC